jgi:hypothetical protein
MSIVEYEPFLCPLLRLPPFRLFHPELSKDRKRNIVWSTGLFISCSKWEIFFPTLVLGSGIPYLLLVTITHLDVKSPKECHAPENTNGC